MQEQRAGSHSDSGLMRGLALLASVATVGTTLAILTAAARSDPSTPLALALAALGLEKMASKSNSLCGNCYKSNRCMEISPGAWTEEKQRCLCEGIGPNAQKPCTMQCAHGGPSPVEETQLMGCQTQSCNHCSRNCGGSEYYRNKGTIANWPYSPTYTSGDTWTRVRLHLRATPHVMRHRAAHARPAPTRSHR
mmetsp:Transcript_33202/g.82645  ORF Transcript_33202/g.82645 Transcript_33202/m.82645 type:complete len:193 (+) Transcript_33202:32-610(+)